MTSFKKTAVNDSVKLVVDAMGGDSAPDVVLEGVALALKEDPGLEVCLTGIPDVVIPFAEETDRCIAFPASEVIEMGDHPSEAIRKKKDSSIVVGCKLVKDGVAQGFFSAGSTGACLAGATLIIGRIKGIKRPALGIMVPAYDKPTFLMDVGANADCKPEYIVQFAQMGSIYMDCLMGVKKPSVGLLNIGSEDTKGSTFARDSFSLLKEQIPNFAGNCEGGDLTQGRFDVVVTDGFTGNICLKTMEGTSKMLLRYIKDALTSSFASKIGAAIVKPGLSSVKEKVDPDKYGGSPLLGVNSTFIIGHGSSNAEAIKNGILVGCRSVRSNFVDIISSAVAKPIGDKDSSERITDVAGEPD